MARLSHTKIAESFRLMVDEIEDAAIYLMDRDPSEDRVMGRQSIAKYATDSATLRQLRKIGVDFSHALLLGKPCPLEPLRAL